MKTCQVPRSHTAILPAAVAWAALGLFSSFGAAQEIRTAAELDLPGLPSDERVLVIESDPTVEPVEPLDAVWLTEAAPGLSLGGRSGKRAVSVIADRGDRVGCPDEGFSTRAYARDSGNDWPWIPANTLVADDLNLEPGSWVISCYDVLIYADNNPAYGCNQSRTVTLRAYDDCNGTPIPGSQESWIVPAYGGPVLLTGVTNVEFEASGTIWFGLTTSIDECDGWYLGQSQINGSTANVFQLETDCAACINPPTCHPWAGFIVILYGCTLPEVTSHPADAAICDGGWHQFCVLAQGTGTLNYQWQLDEADIPGATSPCYVATTAGGVPVHHRRRLRFSDQQQCHADPANRPRDHLAAGRWNRLRRLSARTLRGRGCHRRPVLPMETERTEPGRCHGSML